MSSVINHQVRADIERAVNEVAATAARAMGADLLARIDSSLNTTPQRWRPSTPRIGTIFAAARVLAGETQKSLAVALGLSHRSVTNCESKNEVSARTLDLAATWFQDHGITISVTDGVVLLTCAVTDRTPHRSA